MRDGMDKVMLDPYIKVNVYKVYLLRRQQHNKVLVVSLLYKLVVILKIGDKVMLPMYHVVFNGTIEKIVVLVEGI